METNTGKAREICGKHEFAGIFFYNVQSLITFSDDDYGRYVCQASNSAGASNFEVTLEEPGMYSLDFKNSYCWLLLFLKKNHSIP